MSEAATEKVSDVKVTVPPAPDPELELLITWLFISKAAAEKTVILPAAALDAAFVTPVKTCPSLTEPVPEVVMLTVPPAPVPELEVLIELLFVVRFPYAEIVTLPEGAEPLMTLVSILLLVTEPITDRSVTLPAFVPPELIVLIAPVLRA